MKDFIKKNALYGVFAMSLVAMLGSLYFSEIANYPPCELCWYQRIALYPIVFISGFAIFKKNRDILLPAFVLVVIGWLIGVFHNLLYYEILPEAAAPCLAGISCTTKYIEWFGFLTIPLLALLGSTGILIALIIHWKASKGEQN
jgi:disulfide bond formation protein DsbB